ncbi:hypothetical protein QD460_21290 [Rhizobium jaguaris]|uniref:MurR/RpiR family transcriptional regulator n=1 Tax=Rhizobium jaguaris TaxID=1312183 RepID=UPI0039BF7DE1
MPEQTAVRTISELAEGLGINPSTLTRLAKRLGYGGFAFASFLTYGLAMLRSDVALLDAPRLGEAEGLAQLEPGDVLVVASCAPYTRNVAEVAALGARRGLDVIAVTDTRSPLVPPARHAFLVPHASSFFSNSMGAYIIFCEGLLNLVARALADGAIDALAKREALIRELRIEIDRD